MKKMLAIMAAAWIAFSAAPDLGAVVIRIGSVAPERSPWGKALEEVAREWERISEGAVQVKIHGGGAAGSELNMIRMIRIGNLQGGVFTNMGLAKIERSVLALNMPFLFDSLEEFNAVFEAVKPALEKNIESMGYKVVLWTQAGWVNFFAKNKIVYPDDLRKHKVSITNDEPELEQLWKRMGFQVVPGDMKDLMVQLQSGMATAAYLPAVLAASAQYFAVVPHMLDLPLSPLLGGLILSDKAWESVPAQYRQPMIEAADKAARKLILETIELEQEAVKMMIDNGLTVHEAPPDALEKWREGAARTVEDMVGKAFPRDIYDEIMARIEEYRKSRGK
jgi:TRAP-type transport system periplasmic protein